MKFQFKIQQYQTDAVNSVINAFAGQPFYKPTTYIRDLGNIKRQAQTTFYDIDEYDEESKYGFENAKITLTDKQILDNIHTIQSNNNIRQSAKLINDLGRCSLDIEMETGTGKTYVYIKTMFELNKKYGWSKFIVVVPSIAIREGVKKSFEITGEHFMEHYGKKARFFIYNSKNLTELDNFSSSAGINVMIINMQAFNTSMKEGGRSKEARKIYEKCDEFASRRPIDVVKANKPIIILDEPQKMGGEATQKALKNFNPLFCLNYSATHKNDHNIIYVLDALDAYNKRLVKKIEVKGFEVKNLRGTDKYLYLEDIIISAKKPPVARIEMEISYNKSINREIRMLGVGANLYHTSKKMEQYKDGYAIKDIDPKRGTVTFLNGEVISKGDIVGDISENNMRRIQIRETIISHFEKESAMFEMGIKTLSLFFIDEVAKYRVYNEAGEEINSEYSNVFEQEYINVLNEYIRLDETPYIKYLKSIEPKDTHKGYFSIDKKTGHSVNSETKRNSSESDDISAYDLILKNKERLLSFEEPTRFIFSHSALREGWDNPNVFQICTLKHSDSSTQKRQEVGRGLRLCVNQHGDRMDMQTCGDDIHNINKLTVIASESYKNFVSDLQKQIKEVLYDRPSKATIEYFIGKTILVGEEKVQITKSQAHEIYRYLLKNDYIDKEDNVSDIYRADLQNQCIVPLPIELKEMTDGIQNLIQGVFDDKVLNNMIEDANKTSIKDNPLNDNFKKEQFQTLWKSINHKYAYRVDFESNELIEKAIKHINDKMNVAELKYIVTTAGQKTDINEHDIERGDSFSNAKTRTETLKFAQTSQISYDLIGKIAEGTSLTRKTVAKILKGLEKHVFTRFKYNPEEFINKAIILIKEQKATMIVEHISYSQIEGEYESTIFTAEKNNKDYSKAYRADKNVQDFIFPDGFSENSVERRFAQDLDGANEVCVYAKLPTGFKIPTPVGNYSPDWAIAFNEGKVKHIFFVAETKGTMSSMELKEIEKAKISCAKKLFNSISTDNLRYDGPIDSYQNLLDLMEKI